MRPQRKEHAGEVRIVGGQWRSRRLKVPTAPESLSLRPTPDRVRETLFNWLGQDLTGWHCLDAFAGTGALGLEAASRGATLVSLVEQSRDLAAYLQAAVTLLQAKGVTVVRGDGLVQLRQWGAQASLDLVFLDPPYDSDAVVKALPLAAAAVKPTGFIYLEAPQVWDEETLNQTIYPGLKQDGTTAAPGALWRVHRHLKAGQVHAHLLQRVPENAAPKPA